jgi:hypothetical protein
LRVSQRACQAGHASWACRSNGTIIIFISAKPPGRTAAGPPAAHGSGGERGHTATFAAACSRHLTGPATSAGKCRGGRRAPWPCLTDARVHGPGALRRAREHPVDDADSMLGAATLGRTKSAETLAAQRLVGRHLLTPTHGSCDGCAHMPGRTQSAATLLGTNAPEPSAPASGLTCGASESEPVGYRVAHESEIGALWGLRDPWRIRLRRAP